MKHELPLSAICLLMASFSSLLATDFSVDGINYSTTTDRNVAVTTSKNLSGAVTIPTTVTYNDTSYCVTSIESFAFPCCTSLTSITIPNSVTSIESFAFMGCTGLTSITIPNGVTSIGSHAFDRCSNLTSVTIPNSVTVIEYCAFYDCESLTSINIPSSVTSIGEDALWGCSNLTSITVDSNNSIYDSRNNCNAIIATASDSLIYGCINTTIPNGVTSIGKHAFGDLTSINVPSSVISIKSSSFSICDKLTSITVDQDNSIYDSRNNCNAIIETASNRLIQGCQNTIIPNSVKEIGSCAFNDCTGLTSVTIPSSVTSIGDEAFTGCTGLTSVTIPSSVTSIGNGAFWKCTNLTNVTIPNSVTSMGDVAFGACPGLTFISIPNRVTSIGKFAFYYCSGLTNIIIPSSVTSIGESAFIKCDSLKSVTNLATTPQEITDDVFTVKDTLHVLPSCGNAYRTAEVWKNFKVILEDAENYTQN